MDLFSLFQAQIPTTANKLLIAFSGGLDSTALLSLVKKLSEKRPHLSLRAIHIHHGLSPNSDTWTAHCQQLCEQFAIPLIIEKVKVEMHDGIEAGAREARYQAISTHIQPDEYLVTAHHLNDQTETFFLALKRGAGLQGLGAMQKESQLFGMPILRPLLSFSRNELEDYVQQENLSWVEDESNQDNHYDRNFLRNQILPELRQRWGHFDHAVQRAAQHCFEQQQLINELLQDCFEQHILEDQKQFSLVNFLDYSSQKQTALLRMWLAKNQIAMPTQVQLMHIIDDVIKAKSDASPQFQLGEHIIRRYQQCLYLTEKFTDLSQTCLDMPLNQQIALPDNLGTIYAAYNEQGILVNWNEKQVQLADTQDPIQIRFAYTGKVKRQHNRPAETIKKIWQELGVPPWQRNRIPLIFYGETLQSAVGFFRVFQSEEK